MTRARILLVDDDRNFLRVLEYQVGDFGFEVLSAASSERALELLGEGQVDLVVSDLKMPGMDGLQLLREIRRRSVETPVILLTAHGSIDEAVDAIKAGAFDFLTKPFEREQLRVLQRREIDVIGDPVPRRVDVRIITASNRDL